MLVLRVLIVAMLLAGSFAFLRAAWRAIVRARASRSWPEVPAEIVESSTKLIGHYTTYRVRSIWEVEVSYVYAVYGKWYSGHRHRFSIWRFGGMTFEMANEAVARYYPGAHVTVRYDPDHPKESVLEPRADRDGVTTCIMWGTMALLAAAYLPLAEFGAIPRWLD